MNHEHRTRSRFLRYVALPVVVFAVLWVVPPGVAGNGYCIRASIGEPVVLPDGSVHPAGTLRICVRPYSPVAALHETSIDGRTFGLFLSRVRISENPPEDPRPVMVFGRDPRVGLTLLGYTLPGSERTVVYWLDPAIRKAPDRSGSTPAGSLASFTGTASSEIRLVHAAFR